ncbi:MAG: hypothetical protein KA314_30535 [Chloroflexi bacterium]|nr:hypothetical protein [Chloroflexota bacterium]MBP8060199.1 hypothetical protein [Chloroflexota bacterium]
MSEPVYKVSIVVADVKHPGAIMNSDRKIEIGDVLEFDGKRFEAIEVEELMPPVGGFGFLHVTCRTLVALNNE